MTVIKPLMESISSRAPSPHATASGVVGAASQTQYTEPALSSETLCLRLTLTICANRAPTGTTAVPIPPPQVAHGCHRGLTPGHVWPTSGQGSTNSDRWFAGIWPTKAQIGPRLVESDFDGRSTPFSSSVLTKAGREPVVASSASRAHDACQHEFPKPRVERKRVCIDGLWKAHFGQRCLVQCDRHIFPHQRLRAQPTSPTLSHTIYTPQVNMAILVEYVCAHVALLRSLSAHRGMSSSLNVAIDTGTGDPHRTRREALPLDACVGAGPRQGVRRSWPKTERGGRPPIWADSAS